MSDAVRYAECEHSNFRYSHHHHSGGGCSVACSIVCLECGSQNFYRKEAIFCSQTHQVNGWEPVDQKGNLEFVSAYADVFYEQAEPVSSF